MHTISISTKKVKKGQNTFLQSWEEKWARLCLKPADTLKWSLLGVYGNQQTYMR